jgi:hypothetical protein
LTEPGDRVGIVALICVGEARETPVAAAPPIETVEPSARFSP